MPSPSARQKFTRMHGFQAKVAAASKGKTFKFVRKPELVRNFVRLPTESYNARVAENSNGVLTFKHVDGTDTDVTPLRSLAGR